MRLIEFFDSETDWTKGKLRWRQSLQGFIIGVFKKFDFQAMDKSTIEEHVRPVRTHYEQLVVLPHSEEQGRAVLLRRCDQRSVRSSALLERTVQKRLHWAMED